MHSGSKPSHVPALTCVHFKRDGGSAQISAEHCIQPEQLEGRPPLLLGGKRSRLEATADLPAPTHNFSQQLSEHFVAVQYNSWGVPINSRQ